MEEKFVFNAVELLAVGKSEPKYLLGNLLPEAGLAVLAGKPDIGKSQLARQLCIHVGLGLTEFLGMPLHTRHQSSIYVSTEDSPDAIRYQLAKQLDGIGKAATDSIRFLFGDSLGPDAIEEKLRSTLTAKPADLVVIDSFGDIFRGGDGNNNMAMRNTLKPFAKIAGEFNCLIIFIHHINKAAYSQAPGQEHIQGGSGLVQKIRTALMLSDGEGNIRHLATVKANYTSKALKQNALVLEFSEETLLFSNTGSLKPNVDLGSKPFEHKEEKYSELEDIAQTIFAARELTYSLFVREYCTTYGKGSATAKRIHRLLRELELIESCAGGYKLKAMPTTTAPII